MKSTGFSARLPVLVGLLVVLSAVGIGVNVVPDAAADREAVPVPGAYSCCGSQDCSILAATAACPQGQTQCAGVTVNGKAAKCCVSACNDPNSMPAD